MDAAFKPAKTKYNLNHKTNPKRSENYLLHVCIYVHLYVNTVHTYVRDTSVSTYLVVQSNFPFLTPDRESGVRSLLSPRTGTQFLLLYFILS
jgi:hypothetical protein